MIFTKLRSYLIIHLHMKHCIITIYFLASFIGGIQAQTSKSYSIESAVRFIELARAAEQGKQPSEADWEALFATKGYQSFFSIRTDWKEWQQNIRKAFTTVFDPACRAMADSIALQPMATDAPFENYFIVNFYQIRQRMDSLEHFLHHSDFEQLMEQAYSRVKEFLPADAKNLPLTDLPMFYLAFDPESRAMGGAVFFDINQVYEDGTEGFINTAAHELHHHYMDALWDLRYPKDSDDPALTALVYNQMEGTADLISKPEMPVTKLGLYGPEIVKMYNDDYAATPEVLKQLDNLTCDYAAGKITAEQFEEASGCAHFGGHTTGDYMVFLIRDQLGQQTAIDCFCDIPAFVRRYNEAAAKADTYVFSDAFVQYIDKVCQEMKGE